LLLLDVHRSLTYYNRLSLLAVIFFGVLVSLQVVWLIKAVEFQEGEIIHRLKEVVGDLGLEVNGLDHAAFHGKQEKLSEIETAQVAQVVESFLSDRNISGQTYFAIFQDTTDGIFRSNGTEHREALVNSEVKTCLSCIISFWTIPESDSISEDLDELDYERLSKLSTFSYYSPVKGNRDKRGQTIWLTLYQPDTMTTAVKSLIYLFALNIALLFALLALFRLLLRSLSRHKQLAKVKNDFFNNMTHEFKTPISSIRLASTVLRAETNAEKRTRFYDLIERESKSLEQQIDKLLEYSLLENKEVMLEKVEVDLCALIEKIPEKLRLLLDDKSGRVHLSCQSTQTPFIGDPDHLLNSFCNLVENSLKHAPAGTQIWVSIQQVEGFIRVSFKDDGPGIAKEDQDKIFSRFYRGQANGIPKSAGFGIGLSYVRNIIEGHQGKITLNPHYQHGTEFIIQF